jgi:hypothetical protein
LWLLGVLPLREFGRFGLLLRIAFLAAWAALGWAVGARPIAPESRRANIGAALAGMGCIVSLIVAVALEWEASFEAYGRGGIPFSLAALLALLAAAFSFAARRP